MNSSWSPHLQDEGLRITTPTYFNNRPARVPNPHTCVRDIGCTFFGWMPPSAWLLELTLQIKGSVAGRQVFEIPPNSVEDPFEDGSWSRNDLQGQ